MTTDRSIALVTGAARGIGLEIARQLAARGFHVLLAARHLDAAEDAAANVGGVGVRLDVTSADDIVAAVRTIDELGRLDVLVNNAGTVPDFDKTVLTSDLDDVEQAWRTNVLGTWRLIRAMTPLLTRSPNPRIVNVAAASGSHGDTRIGLGVAPPDRAAYTVTKAALGALTHKLAVELPQARVNAVDPGQVGDGSDEPAEGRRSVQQGAASVVWAALVDRDGPTGGFFRDGRPVPW